MQKTLSGNELVVFADHRERNCNVVEFLESMDCKVNRIQLETGDYVISNTVAIERKSVKDFAASILDGRLFDQLVTLSESYEKPLLLLEGRPHELFAVSNIHKNALIGALSSIALNYRVPVLFAENERETAEFIYVITKRLQSGKGRDIALRKGRTGLTTGEQQRYIVESLPGIGPKGAKRLLEKFGSVSAIFNATQRELEKVDKLGPKKAKKIIKLLGSKYEP